MAKSKTLKTPEQVRIEAATSLAFNKAKTAVLEKVLSMRKELEDNTFDGSDSMIGEIPSGKADDSVEKLKQLIAVAIQSANAVGINFKENLPSYVAYYEKQKQIEKKYQKLKV